MKNPYIDSLMSQTDSVHEFNNIYGIDAAQTKIKNEINRVMDMPSDCHSFIYASEMTWMGNVSSMRPSGLQIREPSNISLQMSFQSQAKIIENTAANGYSEKLFGPSANMIIGAPIQVGTQYNRIIVNEKFVAEENSVKKIMETMETEL